MADPALVLAEDKTTRNDGTFPLHELAEKSPNLLILPGTKPTTKLLLTLCFLFVVPARFATSSGPDFFFIQPCLNILLRQLPRDLAGGWLVLAGTGRHQRFVPWALIRSTLPGCLDSILKNSDYQGMLNKITGYLKAKRQSANTGVFRGTCYEKIPL